MLCNMGPLQRPENIVKKMIEIKIVRDIWRKD